jgi:hypothetical protein
MSLRLAYNIDNQRLKRSVQVPAYCNVHGDVDYAYTKELIYKALREAEIENASVLDRNNGYEVRLSDLYQRQLFMFYFEGDRREDNSFQIDTDKKSHKQVARFAPVLLEKLGVSDEACIEIRSNAVVMHFRTRSAFVTTYEQIRALNEENATQVPKNTPAPT